MDVTNYKMPPWAIGQRVLNNGKVMDVNEKGEMFLNEEWVKENAAKYPGLVVDITKAKEEPKEESKKKFRK